MKLQVTYQAPTFWSGAYGTKPSPAPVYGKALERTGAPLELDEEVMAYRQSLSGGQLPVRGKVVAIGDEGLPGRNTIRIRPYASAVLSAYSSEDCEPHAFDEYEWLVAETNAAADMAAKGVDLSRCIFGDFYFEPYQRQVMKRYLEIQQNKTAVF